MRKRKVMNNGRVTVSEPNINYAVLLVKQGLENRLKQYGYDSFASIHEILGVMDEEHYELLVAVHQNDNEQVISELVDIAVGALFGIATLKQKQK
jgi:hypothetical protein